MELKIKYKNKTNINFNSPYQKVSNISKPEEGWYGQPKYCLKKAINVIISFAVVFGLLGFCS